MWRAQRHGLPSAVRHELRDVRARAHHLGSDPCAVYVPSSLIIDSPTDPWGAYWALITLSPVLILTVYIAVFMHRRELTYLNALLGQIVCEYINLRLKKRIKQPRPTSTCGVSDFQMCWAQGMACPHRIRSSAGSSVHSGACIFFFTGQGSQIH